MRILVAIHRVFTVLAAGVVLVLGLSFAAGQGAFLFGAQNFIVRGPSMTPTIPVGAMIYVNQRTPDTGEVVAFTRPDGAMVTHRVLSASGEGDSLTLRTKGDANTAADADPVMPDQVVGTVVGYLPYLGFVTAFISQPSGALAAVLMLASLALARSAIRDDIGRRGAYSRAV